VNYPIRLDGFGREVAMSVEEGIVGEALKRWQDVLRLRDWDIQIEVVRENWRKNGDIKVDAANKLAALLVNQAVDPVNLEEIVIHELVHLKLHGLDQMIEELLTAVYGGDENDPKRSFAYGQFMDRLESATQDLTKALLTAGGGKLRLLSKPLRDAIDQEVKGGRHA